MGNRDGYENGDGDVDIQTDEQVRAISNTEYLQIYRAGILYVHSLFFVYLQPRQNVHLSLYGASRRR